MAAKRTKQPSQLPMNLYLGVALRVVCVYGRDLFSTEPLREEREELADWMQELFPSDRFDFWRSEQELADRRRLEADALLEALQDLVEGQVRRLKRSQTVVRNLLLRFRQLHCRALLRRVQEQKVRSRWRLASNRGAEADKRALEAWQEDRDAVGPSGEGAFSAETGLPVHDEQSFTTPEQVEAVLGELWRREVAFLADIGRRHGGDELTLGEKRAICQALDAIHHGACYGLRSLRGNALSRHLSEAQMRALRRACARCERVKPFLTEVSQWCIQIRRRLPQEGSQPREGMRRRRVGRVFLEMAEQAEQGGYARAGAGLRARHKWEWGQRLTPEEQELMVTDAAEWVVRVSRPTLLEHIPDLDTEVERILREDSPAAAADFAQQALLLAIGCWPQGAAASLSPEDGG